MAEAASSGCRGRGAPSRACTRPTHRVDSARPMPGGADGDRDARGRSAVVVALVANPLIAVAKILAGAWSGSAALLSEAAHSVADSLNEVFLLAALARSRRRPDSRHPFRYGKERFFWSLLAAVGIFTTGACFSAYQALRALMSVGGPNEVAIESYRVVYLVLTVALVAEGSSLAKAVQELRRRARQRRRTLMGGDERWQ